MKISEFKGRLTDLCTTIGIPVDPAAVERMGTHQSLLKRWARRVNLVGNAAPHVTLETHFLDSIALLRLIGSMELEWTDVGSGAGFPGLVLAAIHPDRPIRLLEPLEKRISFLSQVSASMRECSIQLELGRTDALVEGSQTALISRAVLPPPQWMAECGRLLATDGWAVLMTAHGPDEATHEAARQAGLTEERRDVFTLPGGAKRCNVLYRRMP